MSQTRHFIPCLNKQFKLYNCTIGSLVGVVFFTILGLIIFGLIGSVISGVLGFLLGDIISNALFTGELQKLLYIYLPFAKLWLSPNIADSSDREEI